MKLPSYFKDFLSSIEPSASCKEDQQSGHKRLRKRLAEDQEFKTIHVNTFLQGSYKRNTAIHPGKDVDIVVVTSLDPDDTTPADANALLGRVLRRYYPGKVTQQNRSFCVSLSYVTMDVVIAASRRLTQQVWLVEAVRKAETFDTSDDWSEYPLLIPDRDLGRWVETHPKSQLRWTTGLNGDCGGYFVPLVKMFKWWRQETYQRPKYPKGYVLERLAGECVDKTKRDHAEGFVQLLENINATYSMYASLGIVPTLPDPGVPSHNVAHRLSVDDFKTFMAKVQAALPTAREALDNEDTQKSADFWRRLFGEKFPAAPTAKASFPPVPVRPNKPAGFA